MISVCMATYNGENFIKEQIDSILLQLGQEDELIISDDSSSDSTLDIISSYSDSRIVILSGGQFNSPVYNFENALKHSKGEYIFLSDQDDIWKPNRISTTMEIMLNNEIECVLCNRDIIDRQGNIIQSQVIETNPVKASMVRQIWHNPYMGCCMAFNRKLLDVALPFPENLPMHDLWIGLLGALRRKNAFIKESLISYRRHGGNVTTGKSPFSVAYRISYRYKLYRALKKRLKERI